MFRTTATSVESYFRFDEAREHDLRKIDAAISEGAPLLRRWFVPGSKGKVGMRMIMIGYGHFFYRAKSSPEPVKWPVIGLALQKNYLSLYCSASKGDHPFVLSYATKLGKVRISPKGVINFVTSDEVDCECLRTMARDLQSGLQTGKVTTRYGKTDGPRPTQPGNPVGRRRHGPTSD